MSGPKTSFYTLTLEQRRILAEQRKIRAEQELLAKRQKEAKAAVVEADQILAKAKPLFKEAGLDNKTLSQVTSMRKAAMDLIIRASEVGEASGLISLKETNKSLAELSRELVFASALLSGEYESAQKTFHDEVAEHIDKGFELSFEICSEDASASGSLYRKKILSELASIQVLLLTEEQKSRIAEISAKAEEIIDSDFLKNYYAMTVSPFAKACRAYHDAYMAHGEEYERKCFLYDSNARKIGITTEHIPFSAGALALLDARIKETEEVLQKLEEQAYISQSVDEVMQEMGYTILGNREIVRRNGRRFRNELYLFAEGTAVNVTYSSDGQITMELGGMGREDRIPSGEESMSLTADMQAFCEDYSEIERRLQKRGIVTRRMSVLPPEPQYAQIINISDFDLQAQVSEYEARRGKRRATKPGERRAGE